MVASVFREEAESLGRSNVQKVSDYQISEVADFIFQGLEKANPEIKKLGFKCLSYMAKVNLNYVLGHLKFFLEFFLEEIEGQEEEVTFCIQKFFSDLIGTVLGSDIKMWIEDFRFLISMYRSAGPRGRPELINLVLMVIAASRMAEPDVLNEYLKFLQDVFDNDFRDFELNKINSTYLFETILPLIEYGTSKKVKLGAIECCISFISMYPSNHQSLETLVGLHERVKWVDPIGDFEMNRGLETLMSLIIKNVS